MDQKKEKSYPAIEKGRSATIAADYCPQLDCSSYITSSSSWVNILFFVFSYVSILLFFFLFVYLSIIEYALLLIIIVEIHCLVAHSVVLLLGVASLMAWSTSGVPMSPWYGR